MYTLQSMWPHKYTSPDFLMFWYWKMKAIHTILWIKYYKLVLFIYQSNKWINRGLSNSDTHHTSYPLWHYNMSTWTLLTSYPLWHYNMSTWTLLTFFAAPTFAFFVPRTFFCLFFLSFLCFLPDFLISSKPCYKYTGNKVEHFSFSSIINHG